MFLERLKKETAYYHHELESSHLSVKLMSEEVSLDDYKKYLHTIYIFQSAFEKFTYSNLTGLIPDIESRRKTTLMEKDLSALQVCIDNGKGIKKILTGLDFSQPLQLLGAFYVMEGSALGGVIIARHLHKQLGAIVEGKTIYLEVYGKELSSKWKSFLGFLLLHGTDEDSQNQIIEGAIQTYSALKHWFEKEALTSEYRQ